MIAGLCCSFVSGQNGRDLQCTPVEMGKTEKHQVIFQHSSALTLILLCGTLGGVLSLTFPFHRGDALYRHPLYMFRILGGKGKVADVCLSAEQGMHHLIREFGA